MPEFVFTRKQNRATITKDGAPYSHHDVNQDHAFSSRIYKQLADRHTDSAFEWWDVLHRYYKAGAPAEWSSKQ